MADFEGSDLSHSIFVHLPLGHAGVDAEWTKPLANLSEVGPLKLLVALDLGALSAADPQLPLSVFDNAALPPLSL